MQLSSAHLALLTHLEAQAQLVKGHDKCCNLLMIFENNGVIFQKIILFLSFKLCAPKQFIASNLRN